MSQTYPISLVLAKQAVLVVGGGGVAERKVRGLLSCDAEVTIVSPEITSGLKQLVDERKCVWNQRCYETKDIQNVTLVIACTNDEIVNIQVSKDAKEKHLWVNVADCPDLCTFYLPSVLRRGMLSIAVSTEGSSPMTARYIREKLEGQFDDAMAVYLELLQSWRATITPSLPEEKRQLFWQRACSGEVYELVSQGQEDKAEALLADLHNELKSAE